MTTQIEKIYDEFTPGSKGFVRAVSDRCGYEISDDEIRRIGLKSKTAAAFEQEYLESGGD